MADFRSTNQVEVTMKELKTYIASTLSCSSLIEDYFSVIDGFLLFVSKQKTVEPMRTVAEYYALVTGAKAYERPSTNYLRKKARGVLMVRDRLSGRQPALKYCYGTPGIPVSFSQDIIAYRNWMMETGKSPATVDTRIARLKVFLIYIDEAGCKSTEQITNKIFSEFIGSLTDKNYSNSGKTNILYTLRNYLSCPCINAKLTCNPMPLITGMHSKKHERLASCYSANEIQQVLTSVDRTTKTGKMMYLMMLLACVYGLRVSDIRQMVLTSFDWTHQKIKLHQQKTKRYLELPLTQEVTLALLDYMKNARPNVTDTHLFIKQRSPHTPYAVHDHFSYKVAAYFKKAGINTDNKHCGLHSMRHSLATELSEDSVPVSEIATILGHTNSQSTINYIWADIKHLKAAALEVFPYDK